MNRSVLLRVFGAEGMIDRHIENPTFEAIIEHQKEPLYYGRFGNGRIEGFWSGSRALKTKEMAEKDKSIRHELAQLHAFVVPSHLQHYQKAGLWDQIWLWFEQASVETTGEEIAKPRYEEGTMWKEIDFSLARKQLEALQGRISKDAAVAFCHNDLLAGNIMFDEQTEK